MQSYTTLELNSDISNLVIHTKGNIIFINSKIDSLLINEDFNNITINKKGLISSIIFSSNLNRVFLKNKQQPNSIKITDKGKLNQIQFNDPDKDKKEKQEKKERLNNLLSMITNMQPASQNEINGMASLMNRMEEIKNNENDNKKEEEKLKNQLILELDEFQYKNIDKFLGKEGKSVDDSCSICLEKFSIIDVIKELPCRHIFHKKCLLQWLKKSDFCPLCKNDLRKEVELRKDDLKGHIK